MVTLRNAVQKLLNERGEKEEDIICVWVREFMNDDYSEEKTRRLSWDEVKNLAWVSNGIQIYTAKTIYFLVEYDSNYYFQWIPRHSKEPREVKYF